MANVNVKVESPKIEYKLVRNYSLKNLKKDFEIPEFQRRVDSRHVRKMVDSILKNEFFSNWIKYYTEEKTGKRKIVDGQHTTEALYAAYEIHGVHNYDILFVIYEEKLARKIFRKVNSAKPIQLRDHTRALDDSKTPFFNELKPFCDHQGMEKKPTFISVLHAMNYAKGTQRQVGLDQLEQVLDALTKAEIELCRRIMYSYSLTFPIVRGSKMYQAPIFRNIFRLAHEEKLSDEAIKKLITTSSSSKKLIELSSRRPQETMPIIYKIMIDDLLPRILKSEAK